MSFLTAQDIFTRVDHQRRDDSDSAIDATKKLAALTAVLQIIASRANFKFAVRKKIIEYLPGYPEYSLVNVFGIEDFRDVKELRMASPQTDNWPFPQIEADEFWEKFNRGNLNNNSAVDWRDGNPVLLINHQGTKPKTALHAADSVTDNGTWAADTSTSDAVNIDSDDLELGGSAIKFDIDVSQSVNNTAAVAVPDMEAVDLTDFLDQGHVRGKVFLPDDLASYISGITLRWGSSTTAYYEVTISAPADGNAWQAGDNQVDFDWADATVTGSPDIEEIDYVRFAVNYSASMVDCSGVRFTDLQMVYPERLELNYYSTFLAQTTGGTRQYNTSEVTDKILVPHRHMETVVEGVLWQIMDQMGTNNGEDSERHRNFFEYGSEYDGSKKESKRMGGMKLMIRELGVKPVTETRRMRPKMYRET